MLCPLMPRACFLTRSACNAPCPPKHKPLATPLTLSNGQTAPPRHTPILEICAQPPAFFLAPVHPAPPLPWPLRPTDPTPPHPPPAPVHQCPTCNYSTALTLFQAGSMDSVAVWASMSETVASSRYGLTADPSLYAAAGRAGGGPHSRAASAASANCAHAWTSAAAATRAAVGPLAGTPPLAGPLLWLLVCCPFAAVPCVTFSSSPAARQNGRALCERPGRGRR